MNTRQKRLLMQKKAKLGKELEHCSQESCLGVGLVAVGFMALLLFTDVLMISAEMALGVAVILWASHKKARIDGELEQIEYRLAGK